MKKLISAILIVSLLFSLKISVFAFEIKNQIIPAPVITEFSEKASGEDRIYSFSFTDSLFVAEELRELIYSVALEELGSIEKLMASNQSYLAAVTKNYCQISVNNSDWHTVKEIKNSFSLSFFGEILPALKNADENLSPLIDGFSLKVRILTASENFREENVKTVYVYTASEIIEISCPSFCYIKTNIPSDAVFSETFSIDGFFNSPVKEDILLPVPERTGYNFDGWSLDGEKRISFIPAGSRDVVLTSHWIPKVYEINYFITTYDTDKSFSLGGADNSHNPVEYTVGEAVKIRDIKPPIAGFTFDGWYLTKDFSGERITEIKAGETGDKLLYAKWLSDKDLEEIREKKRQEFIKNGKFGDANDDGSVSAADARIVLRAVVGLESIDTGLLKRVDYKNTGKISADNARTTLRISVGLDNIYDILLENGLLPD